MAAPSSSSPVELHPIVGAGQTSQTSTSPNGVPAQPARQAPGPPRTGPAVSRRRPLPSAATPASPVNGNQNLNPGHNYSPQPGSNVNSVPSPSISSTPSGSTPVSPWWRWGLKGHSRSKGARSYRRSIRASLGWVVLVVTTALFILTVLYGLSTTSFFRTRLTDKSPRNTIFILTLLSELTKLGLGTLVGEACDRLQSMFLSGPRGIAILDYFALDRGILLELNLGRFMY